ncbi:hypothetical protein [Flavobacterium sp.]|uniref:hypothetical protein n=1 Tax=Flavobacterium sp. TaxID=239 RepID=UPI0025FD4BE0|nr:hypothetical protein [Flavobacterium sp.]
MALFKDEISNRNAENQMISYLKGNEIASYDYFNANFNRKNAEAIWDKIRKDGFDTAVSMWLIDINEEKIHTPAEIDFYPEY